MKNTALKVVPNNTQNTTLAIELKNYLSEYKEENGGFFPRSEVFLNVKSFDEMCEVWPCLLNPTYSVITKEKSSSKFFYKGTDLVIWRNSSVETVILKGFDRRSRNKPSTPDFSRKYKVVELKKN